MAGKASDGAVGTRRNQKHRTRKDLLRAAARLLRDGGRPSLEAVAEEALVSRATAYRYFPNLDALLLEAALDIAVPEPEAVFADADPEDPSARLLHLDARLHAMIAAHEPQLRLMLALSLQRGLAEDSTVPARQNRRSPLIEAALAPAAATFDRSTLPRLRAALAALVGIEAQIVFRDVLQLDEEAASAARRWAIAALVAAARPSDAGGVSRPRAPSGTSPAPAPRRTAGRAARR